MTVKKFIGILSHDKPRTYKTIFLRTTKISIDQSEYRSGKKVNISVDAQSIINFFFKRHYHNAKLKKRQTVLPVPSALI